MRLRVGSLLPNLGSKISSVVRSTLTSLTDRYFETFRLFTLSVDLTRSCNLNCRHCYLAERSGQGDLDSHFFVNVIEQARKLDVVSVLLSGGEPLLLKGWQDVLTAARRNNMMTTLFSHAGLVTAADAEFIRRAGVYDVAVSIYAMNDDVHDRITGRAGSLQKSLAGIQHLLAAGVHVTVRAVAMAGFNDVSGLRTVAEWVKAHPQSDQMRFVGNTLLMPRDNGDLSPCKYTLSPEKLAEVMVFSDPAEFESLGELSVDESKGDGDAPLCGAGLTALHVEANGEVRPCMALRDVLGDLKIESLKEIWARLVDQRKNQGFVTHADFKDCATCAYKEKCRPCQALSQLEHGSRTQTSRLACQQTYARALASGDDRGLPVFLQNKKGY